MPAPVVMVCIVTLRLTCFLHSGKSKPVQAATGLPQRF